MNYGQRAQEIDLDAECRCGPCFARSTLTNEPSLYMEVSALSRRLTLLFPYRPEILAELAPGVSPPELPARPMLKLFVDGDRLHVALAAIGKVEPSEAVDVAPEATRVLPRTWIRLHRASVSTRRSANSGDPSARR